MDPAEPELDRRAESAVADDWSPVDDVFVAVDRSFTVVYANQAAERLYERDTDLIGAPASVVMGPTWLGPDHAEALRALRRTGGWTTHADHHTVSGTQHVELRTAAWLDATGRIGGIELRARPRRGPSTTSRQGPGAVDTAVDRIVASAVRHRASALQAVVARLVGAATLEDVGAIVCTSAVAAMGASGGHVAVVENDRHARFVCSAGYPDEIMREWGTIDLALDTPVRAALVEGRSVWIRSRADRDAEFPALRSVDLDTSALCVVPIRLGRHPFGCIGLSFPTAREFDADERSFVDAVARAAALAIDRVLMSDGLVASTATASLRRADLEWADSASVDLPLARTTVTRLMGEQPEDFALDMALCTSELLTNAFQHGQPPIRLRCKVFGDQAVIEVDDAARDAPPRMRTPDLDGGRGLHIVEAISSEWGTTSWPWGKTTWARFELPQPLAREPAVNAARA